MSDIKDPNLIKLLIP